MSLGGPNSDPNSVLEHQHTTPTIPTYCAIPTIRCTCTVAPQSHNIILRNFFREFQPITTVSDDSSLSSN